MATVQIRIKDYVKEHARGMLDNLGFRMSSPITLFLHQVIIKKGILFSLMTENVFMPEFETEVLGASQEKEESPAFSDAESALGYLHTEAHKLSKK